MDPESKIVTPECRVCGGTTRELGTKAGPLAPHLFEVRVCVDCRFAFVANPWEEYEQIYDERYYRGRGADPLVDYLFELEHPSATVRQHEWRGLLRIVQNLTLVRSDTRWLDYGCGNGGLVRHVRDHAGVDAVGFDTGWIRNQAMAAGIPFLCEAEMHSRTGYFDIITAVEVIEHVSDPLSMLRKLRAMLRPDGLLFLTTGNARPHRNRILKWKYLNPTVHVSFFEPDTLSRALQSAGFQSQTMGWQPGLVDVIRFKLLKTLGRRRVSGWERLVPWSIVARLLDAQLQLSRMPIGWAA